MRKAGRPAVYDDVLHVAGRELRRLSRRRRLHPVLHVVCEAEKT